MPMSSVQRNGNCLAGLKLEIGICLSNTTRCHQKMPRFATLVGKWSEKPTTDIQFKSLYGLTNQENYEDHPVRQYLPLFDAIAPAMGFGISAVGFEINGDTFEVFGQVGFNVVDFLLRCW